MEFSRQEYWSGLPRPPPGDSNPGLLHCRRILYCLSHQGSPDRHMVVVIGGITNNLQMKRTSSSRGLCQPALQCYPTSYATRWLYIPVFTSFRQFYKNGAAGFLPLNVSMLQNAQRMNCFKHFGYDMILCWYKNKNSNCLTPNQIGTLKTNYLGIFFSFLPQLPYNLVWRWQKFIKEYRIRKIM